MTRLLTLRRGRDLDGTFWHSSDVLIAIIERPPNGALLSEVLERLELIKKLRQAQISQGENDQTTIQMQENEYTRLIEAYKSNPFPQIRQFIADIWKDLLNAEVASETTLQG